MTPQQIQDSLVQEQADRHASKNAIIDRLQAENAALKGQVAQLGIEFTVYKRATDLAYKGSELETQEQLTALQSKSAALVDALAAMDAVPVSIDSLLRIYPNLHQAVSILIQGANSKALYLWDQARQADAAIAAAYEQGKLDALVAQGELIAQEIAAAPKQEK